MTQHFLNVRSAPLKEMTLLAVRGCQQKAYNLAYNICRRSDMHILHEYNVVSAVRRILSYIWFMFGNVHEAFTWSAVEEHYISTLSLCIIDVALPVASNSMNSKNILQALHPVGKVDQWKSALYFS